MKKVRLKINGMHCASCEVLIERKLKQVKGVDKVTVDHSAGSATLYLSQIPQFRDLQTAIKADGYSISLPGPDKSSKIITSEKPAHVFEIKIVA